MPQLHETKYGRKLFESDLPRLIKAMEKIGKELERLNDNTEEKEINMDIKSGNLKSFDSMEDLIKDLDKKTREPKSKRVRE